MIKAAASILILTACWYAAQYLPEALDAECYAAAPVLAAVAFYGLSLAVRAGV